MTDAALAGCETEPIRVPGAIQPHGALLALTEPDLVVVMASDNASAVFGGPVRGRTLDALLPDKANFLRAGFTDDLAELNPLPVTVGGHPYDLVVHRAGGLLVAEFEEADTAGNVDDSWYRRLPLVLQRLAAADSLTELTAQLASDVRRLTGFDRVMVYRFDPQWNGEVIAESRRDDLEPLLGLHYPASDIPAQARALYATNWLRIIPDATYTPVQLTPASNPLDEQPLDLSGAMLRSVSPVHLEYLANMGVRSSMSVSLIDRGRLWGLIACHHYAGPHRPSYRDRRAAEFLGRTASLLLATTEEASVTEAVVQVAQRQAALSTALATAPRTPTTALTGGEVSLLDLIPATGAAMRIGGRVSTLGQTPAIDRVQAIVGALLAKGTRATDALSRELPSAADLAGVASGVLVVPIGIGDDYLAWFRSETLREVSWGGDPNATGVVYTDAGTRLSPRHSFRRWTETVRGTASPWLPHEVSAVEALASQLADVALSRAYEESRLAATLQRTLMLEELPHVRGVELAVRYTPSANDVVGGDWYDLVVLPSGKMSLVLGDVAGHGLSAAAVTAQLRHALRAYVLRADGPAAALRALNDLMEQLLPHDMATAVIAELDPLTGVVTIANAGHPPALLLTADAPRLVGDYRGPALGLRRNDYRAAELTLRGDDRLLLFSDGLVERRDRDPDEQERWLVQVGSTAPRGVDEMLDTIVGELAPPGDDDVTLVAVGLSARERSQKRASLPEVPPA